MASNLIPTKDDFLIYIKRKLGFPQIDVEVTEDQMDLAIYDAIDRFSEYADEGASLRFSSLDLVPGQDTYDMDFTNFAILEIFAFPEEYISSVFPNKTYVDFTTSVLSNVSGSLLNYELASQYLESIRTMIKQHIIFNYNSTTKELYLPDARLDDFEVQKIGILYYERVDKDSPNIFNHPWVKRYAVALAKKQWGNNLAKYEGSVLPNGITLNGASIKDDAKEEIETLETQLTEEYSAPSMFFVG